MIGHIGFAKSNTIIGKIIRLITESEWSHTFIIMDSMGQSYDYTILEADFLGVRTSSYNPEKVYRKTIVFSINKSEEDINSSLSQLYTRNIGKPYGYIQLLGFLFIFFLYKIGIKTDNTFRKGMICTELIYEYLRYLNISINLQKDSITPEELFDFITVNQELFKRENI